MKIISNWILKKSVGKEWNGLIWLRKEAPTPPPHMEGSWGRGNELSGSIKCGEFLD